MHYVHATFAALLATPISQANNSQSPFFNDLSPPPPSFSGQPWKGLVERPSEQTFFSALPSRDLGIVVRILFSFCVSAGFLKSAFGSPQVMVTALEEAARRNCSECSMSTMIPQAKAIQWHVIYLVGPPPPPPQKKKRTLVSPGQALLTESATEKDLGLSLSRQSGGVTELLQFFTVQHIGYSMANYSLTFQTPSAASVSISALPNKRLFGILDPLFVEGSAWSFT